MTVGAADVFASLLDNLKVDNSSSIAARRDEITKALNKDFRSIDGSTRNQMMIGSYGRHTAIRGLSDLDMLYILPDELRTRYSREAGPRAILTRVRDALIARYPTTEVRVDQCVVRVHFTTSTFTFEVQPVFENDDKSFLYPDTIAESWMTTKPREEIRATSECDERTSGNMRNLAKMTRAWRNTHGVAMGGLLIDTLVHRFFEQKSGYDSLNSSDYGLIACDFFEFLSSEPDQDYYGALGSGQRVRSKHRFQPKAKKAYVRSVEAIDAEGKASANKKWRAVFGASVPVSSLAISASASDRSFDDTEEFIESTHPVDIRYALSIDCNVSQSGFRPTRLRQMLSNNWPLLRNKGLDFVVTECTVDPPYELRWKVLNRGLEAERRNLIRGQIVKSTRPATRHETTNFRGDHIVEGYAIKDGVVVARDQIEVTIHVPD